MKKIFTAILPLLILGACIPETPQDITVAQAAELMQDDDVVVLDVRSDNEWEEGYIAGALHINYHGDDFDERIAELPKDKQYVVYCAAGGRSGKTVAKMKESGFDQVHNLQGGINAWRDEGRETVD